jgi:hypothetical protein
LIYVTLQLLHLVCVDRLSIAFLLIIFSVDRRIRNVYVLAGDGENLEFEIASNGEVFW